jgi:hypothetical protein
MDLVSDDYLWDRRGEPDPEIARLERVMGTLRAPEPPVPLVQVRPVAAARAPGRRFVLPFAAVATLAVAVASVWLSMYPPGPPASWEVARLDGAPRVASKPLATGVDRLPVGEWLETDAQARARLKVSRIGQVEVEPLTRVGLISSGRGDYRLRLDRGTLRALIWSAPGQFFIETPAAVAVDLGCAYTLHVVRAHGLDVRRATRPRPRHTASQRCLRIVPCGAAHARLRSCRSRECECECECNRARSHHRRGHAR